MEKKIHTNKIYVKYFLYYGHFNVKIYKYKVNKYFINTKHFILSYKNIKGTDVGDPTSTRD